MAPPTTRATLNSRAIAVRVELADLAAGAVQLAGGLDAGTETQKRHCQGLQHRFNNAAKELANQGTTDAINGVI